MKLIVLILASVTLSAIAQLVLKMGMSSQSVQNVLTDNSLLERVATIATNGRVLLGLGLYGLGALFWLWVLARTDLSFAYPFVGLGFILTMMFGLLFLGEPVGMARITGTLLIVAGVVLVSQS